MVKSINYFTTHAIANNKIIIQDLYLVRKLVTFFSFRIKAWLSSNSFISFTNVTSDYEFYWIWIFKNALLLSSSRSYHQLASYSALLVHVLRRLRLSPQLYQVRLVPLHQLLLLLQLVVELLLSLLLLPKDPFQLPAYATRTSSFFFFYLSISSSFWFSLYRNSFFCRSFSSFSRSSWFFDFDTIAIRCSAVNFDCVVFSLSSQNSLPADLFILLIISSASSRTLSFCFLR